MSSTLHPPVPAGEAHTYAAAVRLALADLAAAQRDDLLEDLDDHLGEVAAEGEGPLVERLGSPSTYAAELRASLGLPPAGSATNRPGRLQRARAGLTRLQDKWGTSAVGREARVIAPTLRPAWWLLRGWIAALAIATGLGWRPFGDWGFLVPRVLGTHVVGGVLVIGFVCASLVYGRRQDRWGPRARTGVVLANVLLVLALPLVVNRDRAPAWTRLQAAEAGSPGVTLEDGRLALVDGRGEPIRNVEVRNADGKPVPGPLFLYDQAGRPLDTFAREWFTPDMPEGRQLFLAAQRDAAGNLAYNAVPLRYDMFNPATGKVEPTAPPSSATAVASSAPTLPAPPAAKPGPAAAQTPGAARPAASPRPTLATTPPATR